MPAREAAPSYQFRGQDPAPGAIAAGRFVEAAPPAPSYRAAPSLAVAQPPPPPPPANEAVDPIDADTSWRIALPPSIRSAVPTAPASSIFNAWVTEPAADFSSSRPPVRPRPEASEPPIRRYPDPVIPADPEPAAAAPSVPDRSETSAPTVIPEPSPRLVVDPLPAPPVAPRSSVVVPATEEEEPEEAPRRYGYSRREKKHAAAAAKNPEAAPMLAAWWWPLWLVNGILELTFRGLGPAGRWTTTPVGRNLLGWGGVLMLAGAVGKGLNDWFAFGWIP
jgi:hypothetical protein